MLVHVGKSSTVVTFPKSSSLVLRFYSERSGTLSPSTKVQYRTKAVSPEAVWDTQKLVISQAGMMS